MKRSFKVKRMLEKNKIKSERSIVLERLHSMTRESTDGSSSYNCESGVCFESGV
jgi:hypothetical protein